MDDLASISDALFFQQDFFLSWQFDSGFLLCFGVITARIEENDPILSNSGGIQVYQQQTREKVRKEKNNVQLLKM